MIMKQHKLPGRQSQAYTILSLIAISGELPKDQVYRLPGGSEYKRVKIIPSLKEKRFITTYYNDNLRGYRLTTNSKNMLLADNPERFESYLTGRTETNILKSEITRRLRLKSIAEAIVTMHNAGVAVYRDDKPDVFYPETDVKQTFSITTPAFYTSREVKNYGYNLAKIRGSRSVGVLVTESKAFVVYNTGNTHMKWNHNSESGTSVLIWTILRNERLPQYGTDYDRNWGLMLGDSMEQIYPFLTNKGGTKTRHFIFNSMYENFIYLPNDCNGEMVLRLICDTEKRRELNSMLSQDLDTDSRITYVENDGVNRNGEPVLFGYDFNMSRIARFNGNLEMHNKRGTIICFDFQADVLRRYCHDNVTIETIKTDKFKKQFYP
jgi:hypothetical protein